MPVFRCAFSGLQEEVSHVAVVVEVQRRTVRVKGAGGRGGGVALVDSLNFGRLC